MKKQNFFIIIVMLCLVVPVLAADPYDGYIGTSVSGTAPLNVTFTDISYGEVTSWNWTRHDVITPGSTPVSFSTSASPGSVTFNAGNWSIQLTTTNSYGTNTTRANVTFVNVTGAGSPPVSGFTGTPLTGNGTVSTTFTDTSTGSPAAWTWQYRSSDISTWTTFSTTQNPVHTFTYTSVGDPYRNTYHIQLITSNSAGSNTSYRTNYIVVSAPVPLAPVANFTPRGIYRSDSLPWGITIENNTVMQFNDTSTGGTPTSWNWSFQLADGSRLYSSVQNPVVTFNTTAFGEFDRQLILNVSNSAGYSRVTDYFMVHRPPVTPIAEYVMTNTNTGSTLRKPTVIAPLLVSNGQTVTFNDSSYNNPTSWRWDIPAGNGSVYTYYTRNATMKYTDAISGVYPVTFSAINSDGTSTITNDAISITDYTAPVSVSGITNSTGLTTIQWNWTQASDVAGVRIWKDGTLFENVTTNGTLWTGLVPGTTYQIATKTYDADGNLNATFVNATAATASTSVNWSTPGDYYWICPANVTSVTLKIGGPGGSGKGGQALLSAGGGGFAGEHFTYVGVPVTPGVTYLIHLGTPGANASYNADSNSGTDTTALGKIAKGGAGGITLTPVGSGGPTKGGDGGSGFWSTARMALNGTKSDAYDYGIGGLGYCSGGGGGSHDTTAPEDTMGGYGAPGFVEIILPGYSITNIPDFVADKTTSDPGTLIHFTDLSTIIDTAGLTYNWSFGDGGYSSTSGNVQHVYPYTGSYDVSLTLTTTNNSVTETKITYINIVTSPIYPYIPQQVRFKLVDTSGFPLSGVGITATPVNATIPANWSELLFRVNPAVNLQGISVVGMTGSDGSWVAPMLPSYLYDINMFRAYDVNYTIQMYPSQNEYLFTIPIGVVPIQTIVPGIVTYAMSNASINRSHQYFNISYSDTSTQGTDKLSFYVYNLAGEVVAQRSFSGADARSQTFSELLEVSQGQTYTYGFAANQSQYGWINQTQTVTLANQIALIGDAPSWVEEFAAIAIILLFAALFSIYSKPFAMIALPLLTWFFQFYMGWLPSNFVSSIALGVMLTLGVAIYIRQKESAIS